MKVLDLLDLLLCLANLVFGLDLNGVCPPLELLLPFMSQFREA